jgi:hypothetical protein
MNLEDAVQKVLLEVKLVRFNEFLSSMNAVNKVISESMLMAKNGPLNQGFKELGNHVMRSQQALQKFSGEMKKVLEQRGLDRIAKNTGAAGVFGMDYDTWKKVNQQTDGFSRRGARMASRLRMMTQGMRQFRMELLGVMFFGQMMSKTLFGLLKPALEMTGIMDIWTIMLQTVFLPLIITLLPYLIKFMEFFINLPDGVKQAIGWFVLLGAILFALLGLLGSVGLFIGSFIGLFSGGGVLAGIGPAIAAAFTGSLVVISAVVGAIILLAYVIYLAWKENFGNIRKYMSGFIDGIKQMFSGLFEVIENIFGLFKAIFEGDWDGVKEHLKGIVDGILNFFVGLVNAINNLWIVLAIGMVRIFYGVVKTIEGMFIDILNWIKDKISWLIRSTAGIVDMVPGGTGMANSMRRTSALLDSVRYTGLTTLELTQTENPFLLSNQNRTSGNSSQSIVINNSYNVNVSDDVKFERMLQDNSKKMADEVSRIVKTGV